MLKLIDRLIDGITMYRLLLYYLIGLLLAAAVLAQLGQLSYQPFRIILNPAVLCAVCWAINKAFAYILKVPTNHESSLITALILSLIIAPNSDLSFLLAASGLAMASKYLLTINRRHVFNPAAIAVTLTALGPEQSANWWVGTKVMLPFVIIGGILLVRKVRRGTMVVTFLAVSMAASIAYTLLTHGKVGTDVNQVVLSSSLFFLAFVMLTEPLTSPPTVKKQVWYAALTGLLFPPQVHLLSFYSTPERALVAGNIFAYLVSPKTKLFPKFKQAVRIAPSALDFSFDPGTKFDYEPGQYMEWTLPHEHTDARGNRRYFTLASSPTEPDVHLGVRFSKQGSSYKQAMLAIKPTTPVVAAQIAGDFVMPKDKTKKLAFVAGGIGVTPYRSMVKYLLDTNERRDVVMLYSARSAEDVAYRDVFEDARTRLGIHTTYFLTDQGAALPDGNYRASYITAEAIKATVPDYHERTFYISGPQPMVAAVRDALAELHVGAHQIKTDFFPGYA